MTHTARSTRVYRRGILGITLAGATWRVVVLISKWHAHLLLNDSLYYSLQAFNNARGKWFREAGGADYSLWGRIPGAEHPPLTSIVIAPASLLARPEFWERATMTLIGICLIPLVALLARRIGGRRVALIAAALAAVYPNIWMSDSLIMSETLLLLVVVLTLLAAVRHHDRFDLPSAVLLGVVIGVAGYTRSETLIYAPLFALIGVRTYAWRRWATRGVVVLLATTVTVLPWIVYNSSRFNTTVLMSTNDGNTLLGANCPATYGGQSLGGWVFACIEEPTTPVGENSAERSVRRRHEAISYARAHESRIPLVVAARVLRAADVYGLPDLVRGDQGEERPAWAIWAGIASWWLLAPLAAIGLWRTRRGLRYVLLVPVVGVIAVTVVFYGSHRLRAPLEPVVVIAAAMTIANSGPARRALDRVVTRVQGAPMAATEPAVEPT